RLTSLLHRKGCESDETRQRLLEHKTGSKLERPRTTRPEHLADARAWLAERRRVRDVAAIVNQVRRIEQIEDLTEQQQPDPATAEERLGQPQILREEAVVKGIIGRQCDRRGDLAGRRDRVGALSIVLIDKSLQIGLAELPSKLIHMRAR